MKKVYFSFFVLFASLMALKAQNSILRSDPREAGNNVQSASSIITAHVYTPEIDAPPSNGISAVNEFYRSSLYPVPTAGSCTLTISASETKKIKIELIDEAGRVVWQNNETVNIGNNTFSYSFANQSPGIYFLRIQGDNINEMKKLVIAG